MRESMRPVLKGSCPWKRVRRRQEKKGVRIKQKAKRQKVYDVDRPSSESDIPTPPNPIGTESEG